MAKTSSNREVSRAELAAKLQQQIQQVFDSGKILSDETPYTSPDGRPGFYEYIFTPVFAKDGTVEAVAGSTRDISRRKRVEGNLAFLASLSRDLAQFSQVDELMQTIGAKIGGYLNLSLCTFVEINENADEAVVNHDWHRDDAPSSVGSYRLAEYLTDDFQKAGRAGETFVVRDTNIDPRTDAKRYANLKIRSFVCVPLVRGGQWRFLLCIYHSAAYDWPEDEIALMREVTSRVWLRLEAVRAETALVRSTEASEKQRRLYDTILSSMPDLVYVFDLNHRFTYANEALLKMWGRTWENAIGKNCLELGYEQWHAEMHSREIEQVIATKKPIRGEVPFNGTNGRRIYDYIFVPVLDSNGEVEATSGTTRDVTDRKRAEAAEKSEKRVFELMATGASLTETLEALAHQMETLSVDKMASSHFAFGRNRPKAVARRGASIFPPPTTRRSMGFVSDRKPLLAAQRLSCTSRYSLPTSLPIPSGRISENWRLGTDFAPVARCRYFPVRKNCSARWPCIIRIPTPRLSRIVV